MHRFLSRISLAAQIICLTGVSLIVTSTAAMIAVGYVTTRVRTGITIADVQLLRLQLIMGLSVTAVVSIGLVMAAVRQLLLRPLRKLRDLMAKVMEGKLETTDLFMPNRDWEELKETFDRMILQLRDARTSNDDSKRVLSARTRTVDRLLEFSQTIQGAGKMDQVFDTLSQFLEKELSLSGVAILSHEQGAIPPVQSRSVRPQSLCAVDAPIDDLGSGMCPCLRQNLPKQFCPGGSPVRCGIDRCLSLPVEHPAYCIPFNVGRGLQAVVHMLLPIGQDWTDERRQLAQTYVNSAVSALISLHLLAEAEKQSMTDPLTGLYNRRSMQQLMQREVALAERHKHPLSVVMIDIDHFKQVNDAHGHAAGDHILTAFADCVRITLRHTDLAFRYGGDEFIIALPQTPIGQAEQVVEKLRSAFASVDFTHAITGLGTHPTLSIGVTERQASNNVLTLESLLSAVDQALYDAKTNSRNCVRVYPPKAA